MCRTLSLESTPIVGDLRGPPHVLDDLSGAIVVALPVRLLANGADCSATRVVHLSTTRAFAGTAILRLATLFIGNSVDIKH